MAVEEVLEKKLVEEVSGDELEDTVVVVEDATVIRTVKVTTRILMCLCGSGNL